MCEESNSRNSGLRKAANLALVVGLVFWAFIRPEWPATKPWSDGVAGVLMGVAIGMNLALLWKARRSRPAAPSEL